MSKGLKVTKQSIRELLRNIKYNETEVGWKLWKSGAYIFNDKVTLYSEYQGQGTSEILYNGTYSKHITFTEIANASSFEYWQETKVDIIYERVKDMIEEYELERAENE